MELFIHDLKESSMVQWLGQPPQGHENVLS